MWVLLGYVDSGIVTGPRFSLVVFVTGAGGNALGLVCLVRLGVRLEQRTANVCLLYTSDAADD